MGNPAVTYTFVNGAGNYIDATEVNKNFTDLVNAIVSGSTADLGCASLKINAIPFASAVVSAMQGASVTQLTIVNTFTAGSVQVTSNITAANIRISSGAVIGALVVGSAASEGSGTIVVEGGVHVYSGLNVEGSIQAGSLYVNGNQVFSRGSFVATLGGVDTPTSVTGYYAITGDNANVFMPAVDFKATSVTNYMYFSGLPAAITDNLSTASVARAFVVPCPTIGVRNGVAITSGNVNALIMYDVNNPDYVYFTLDGNAAGWLDSGEKGINSRFSMDIPLTGLLL